MKLDPSEEASLILAACQAQATQEELSAVQGLDWGWIQTDSLRHVSLRVLGIARYDNSLLNGGVMAVLVKRLIAAEVAPGGPYQENGLVDLATNAAIAQFFTQLRMPLPEINQYLSRRSRAIVNDPLASLLVAWPQSLTKNPPKLPFAQLPAKVRTALKDAIQDASSTSKAASLHDNKITVQVQSYFAQLSPAVASTAQQFLKKVVAADKRQEITLLSHFVFEAFRTVGPRITEPALVAQLGEANLYTWIAYTIYDDFIDEEGRAATLPVANIAQRQALICYRFHGANEQLINTTFTAMDAANAWEVANCRFDTTSTQITIGPLPNYTDLSLLAERAGGHTLGPLLLAQYMGLTKTAYRHLQDALSHYLIARQLNDDLHDWGEDLHHGHISPVVAHLLKAVAARRGNYSLRSLHLAMQRAFWQHGLQELCNIALDHSNLSIASFEKAGAATDSELFEKIINPLQQSLRASLTTHRDDKNFLREYKKADTLPTS